MKISSRDDGGVGARDGDADESGQSRISLLFYIENTSGKVLQAGVKTVYAKICFASPNKPDMESNESDKVMQEYGKRVQRCFGCFIPYHLKDMWLGEDVSYFCENCKDETMFHFEDFSKMLDRNKLREVTEQDHH
jgi:hypothetical protein